MKKLILSFLFVLVGFSDFAQRSITGKIIDTSGTPVPYIPVALLYAKDSAIVKGVNTDGEGKYLFSEIKPGNYLIKVSAVGYAEAFTSLIPLDSFLNLEILPVRLFSNGINLNEVSVTVAKKLIEFKNGNITVNIAESPLAIGNTLYDLLSRLPGVSVIDDNITIQGKTGIVILIDERPQQLSGQQLVNLLRSINASSIDKIEILKNPPVKYSSQGAGFISVKTNKVKITGFSGSTNLSYQQGFYSNKDGGVSLNYKGKNYTVFSSLNFGNDEFRYTSAYDKIVSFNGVRTDFNQLTIEKNSNVYASYIVGADWFVNKKNTVGIKVEGTQGEATPVRNGNNYLSDSNLGYNRLVFNSVRPNEWNYINYNFNAEHLFDTIGTVIKLSVDYSPNLDLNKGNFENHFLNTSGNNTMPSKIFKSDNNLKFVLYSSKLDFEKNFSKTFKLEVGVKANDQNMLSSYNFKNKNLTTGEYLIDTNLTNVFSYKEKVLAGYVNLQKQFKKYNLQAGVRGENTSIKAGSQTNNFRYTRDYFNLFPMLSVSYNPSDKNSFQMSYNRRINRPTYTSFNPYKFFVNLFVSFQGNPYMIPEYSNSIEFTHGFMNQLYNTISYSTIKNIFYGYPVQNDSTKESVNKTANLANCSNYSYSFYFQKELKKWWMLSLDGIASYLTFSGKIEDRVYSGISFQYYGFINNQFTLPKNIKIELNGQYLSPGSVVIFKNKDRWALNIAIKKSFINNKLNVVVGMNDIFYTMVPSNTAQYLNINSTLHITNDSRRFKASISYNFGKIKVQQRQTKSNQEEKMRLNH